MPLEAVLHDRKPETRSTLGAGPSAIHAVKALCQSGQMLGRNANAGIFDCQSGACLLTLPAQRDGSFRRRVLDRIGNEV